MLQRVQQLFEHNGLLLSVATFVGGGLVGGLLQYLRGRIKVIEYTVAHDRIGVTANDQIMGEVQVTWQGHPVTNLFSSTVTVENRTPIDF